MKREVETDQIKKAFAKVLIELRKESGLSQEKLANKARLERAYISRLERSLVQPSLNTLIKISDGLDVQPEYLFTKFLESLKP